MSDTLTKKLRRAATLQHTNGTPTATPNTIPQSFWPPDPCCQCIATAVANRKTTDVPLNIAPRIAAFLAVHSLTEIWYGSTVGENRRSRKLALFCLPFWESMSVMGILRQLHSGGRLTECYLLFPRRILNQRQNMLKARSAPYAKVASTTKMLMTQSGLIRVAAKCVGKRTISNVPTRSTAHPPTRTRANWLCGGMNWDSTAPTFDH